MCAAAGDLIVLKQGDAIVADGIYISGSELSIDESALTGESDAMPKSFEHPFIMSGTSVLDGEGVMLVIAVGVESTRGRISAALDAGVFCDCFDSLFYVCLRVFSLYSFYRL